MMLQLHNVLCPIDFSETSARALTYAAALTRGSGAHLEVLHVAAAFEAGGASHDRIIAEIQRAIAAAGAKDLDSQAVAREGRAPDAIVERARTLPADLLVMGTHGRGGFNRLLLGSVTEKVLRQVDCPALTVPPAAPPHPAEGPMAFRTILCPIDYSPSSLKALKHALDLARQAGGRVTVLYALEYMDPEPDLVPSRFDPCYPAIEENRRVRQQLVDHARGRLHELAQESSASGEIDESLVVVDRAYKAILQQAGALQVDLIAMGAQGTGGLELMMYGSNTQHVLRAAACPVLTVKA